MCWTIAPVLFSLAGRKINGTTINSFRLVLSTLLFFSAHLLIVGWPSLQTIGISNFGWLALSGILGLALGDTCLLRAILLIGPRLVTLIMTLVPLISVLLGWLIFNESLAMIEILGAILCLGGVIFVISSHQMIRHVNKNENFSKGLWFALVAAVGQTLGLLCAKQGLSGDLPVISAVLIRMAVAMLAMWFLHGFAKNLAALRGLDKKTYALMIAGTVIGPFLGVWFSLQAIELTRVGLATTLMAISPILILPIAHWVLKDQVTRKTLLGSLVAFSGVMIILWRA